MKSIIILAAMLALSACCGYLYRAGDESCKTILPPSNSDPPGRVIAIFKKGVSPADARSIAEDHSMTIAGEYEALHEHSGQVFFHLISDTLTSEEMVRRLEKDSRVHRVKAESTRSVLPDPHRPGTK
jgi:hypothetical protein